MQNKRLAPSLLSADFSQLQAQVDLVIQAGVSVLHLDCMDNHFVPNLTFGPVVWKSLRIPSSVELDVHLMVENPASIVPACIDSGAGMISVHLEADSHLQRTLTLIKERGAKAGVAINPATPISLIEQALEWTDFILLMTVNPGFGGQSFIDGMVRKIQGTRRLIDATTPEVILEVDGGIKLSNVEEVVRAGADLVVAGSAVFGADNPAKAVKDFNRILERIESDEPEEPEVYS